MTDSEDGVTTYTYDALGQLLTEKVGETVINCMTYDNYGNILSKNGVTYTYGDATWKDRLTAYGNQSILYDAQGNPTSYLGHTLTWEKGRQLKSFDGNTYSYNANGIRTSKTVNGVKHTYTLDGTNILREEWCENVLIPLYDNEESVCGIIYNDTPFYFQKNLQGDIIAIANAYGQIVARYNYDAWGVCTIECDCSSVDIAEVNPYRYRGYYYDAEIGMYYLQSRYYDPEVGRFLNEDEVTYVNIDNSIVSCNLFTYCKNAPASAIDKFGYNTAVIAQGSYEWAYMLAAVVPAVAAAKVAIIAAIKSAIAFIWNVFVVVGLIVIVLVLIAAIAITATKVMDLVNEAVRNEKNEEKKGYVVYVLTRKQKDPKSIFYVGRTKDYDTRMRVHTKTKGEFHSYIVVVCKTYTASRAIEQAVLSACIVSKVFTLDKQKLGTGSNQIRGIAKEKVKSFKDKESLNELISLMTCTDESDLLDLMGC